MGSRTGWRSMTPGAMRSSAMNLSVAIGPLSSMGWPSEFTTRPISASPTGTLMMRPVRLTSSPSLISVYSPSSTTPTWSSSRFMAMPATPCGKREQFAGHDLVEAVDAGDAVTERDDRAHFVDRDLAIRSSRSARGLVA